MKTSAPVSYANPLEAFDGVSAAAPMENSAFVSRETGATHWASMLMPLDGELSDDIEDASLYLAVPHKNDLNLGKKLVLRFADEQLPNSSATMAGFFRQPGAYGRFKDFLNRQGQLQAWYGYEARAVEQALREWSEENRLQLEP